MQIALSWESNALFTLTSDLVACNAGKLPHVYKNEETSMINLIFGRAVSRRKLVRGITSGLLLASPLASQVSPGPSAETERLRIGESDLEVTFGGGPLELAKADL